MKQYDKQFKEEAVKTERRQKLLVKIYEIPDEPPDSDNYGANRMYLALRNKGDYTAERPNQKWRSDSTQIPCSDGKLYIAPVMDCYSGEIISLVMADNMKEDFLRLFTMVR